MYLDFFLEFFLFISEVQRKDREGAFIQRSLTDDSLYISIVEVHMFLLRSPAQIQHILLANTIPRTGRHRHFPR